MKTIEQEGTHNSFDRYTSSRGRQQRDFDDDFEFIGGGFSSGPPKYASFFWPSPFIVVLSPCSYCWLDVCWWSPLCLCCQVKVWESWDVAFFSDCILDYKIEDKDTFLKKNKSDSRVCLHWRFDKMPLSHFSKDSWPCPVPFCVCDTTLVNMYGVN